MNVHYSSRVRIACEDHAGSYGQDSATPRALRTLARRIAEDHLPEMVAEDGIEWVVDRAARVLRDNPSLVSDDLRRRQWRAEMRRRVCQVYAAAAREATAAGDFASRREAVQEGWKTNPDHLIDGVYTWGDLSL